MQDNFEKPARRTFLKASAMAAAGLASASSAKKVLGANDRIRIAVVGLRGRGWDHVKGYHPFRGLRLPISAT